MRLITGPRWVERLTVGCFVLAGDGGEGWIRTSVRLRGQIYSLLPLTTRPPLHEACHARTIRRMVEHSEAGAPCGGASLACQRAPPAGVPVALRFARAFQIPTVPRT